MWMNGTPAAAAISSYQKCAVLQGMVSALAPESTRKRTRSSSSGRGEGPLPVMIGAIRSGICGQEQTISGTWSSSRSPGVSSITLVM